MLELVEGRVLIKLEVLMDNKNGVLYPVESSRKKDRGEIIQVGEGCELQVGDHVIFLPNTGYESKQGYIVEESNVTCIYEP
jgi:co-chaperonin GroES (HSP10)